MPRSACSAATTASKRQPSLDPMSAWVSRATRSSGRGYRLPIFGEGGLCARALEAQGRQPPVVALAPRRPPAVAHVMAQQEALELLAYLGARAHRILARTRQ